MTVTIPDIGQDASWSVRTPWETKTGTQTERNGAVTVSFSVPELAEGTTTIAVQAEVSHSGEEEGRPWGSEDQIKYSVPAPAPQPSQPAKEPAAQSQPAPAAQAPPASAPAASDPPAIPATPRPARAKDPVPPPRAERSPTRGTRTRATPNPPKRQTLPAERRPALTAAAPATVSRRTARLSAGAAENPQRQVIARRDPSLAETTRPDAPAPTRRSRAADPPVTPAWFLLGLPVLLFGVLILRRRRSGGELMSRTVPVSPAPPPVVAALEVEAALQEIVAEARARELLQHDVRDESALQRAGPPEVPR